jgi:hypothetical protein
MTPLLEESLVKKHCYTETGALKPKPECRALLINHLILEDMLDIDDAENRTDKTLRALNLWNEPTLEDILREDAADPNNIPSV